MLTNILKATPQLAFLRLALTSISLTLVWLPIYFLRFLLEKFVKKYGQNYGKILDYCDSSLEENYVAKIPKNTIAFSLILNGDLRLDNLKKLWIRNVLQATISHKDKSEEILRYPEFTQYQVPFFGYTFWKNDPHFSVDSHITEQANDNTTIAQFHEIMLSSTFPKKKSPWEFVLIRNFKKGEKTLLLFRCHHTLGDTKSMLKVLVECLGQKELQLPAAQHPQDSPWEKIKFYGLMPFYFVYVQLREIYIDAKMVGHPWCPVGVNVPYSLNLKLSRPLPIMEIKDIAQKNGVTTSAVILAVIAGAVVEADERLKERGIPSHYVLPTPYHPDTLGNYHYAAVMALPNNENTAMARLKKCNEIFLQARSSTLHKYEKTIQFQSGTWCCPVRQKLLDHATFPLVITNIASDKEGFSIGSLPCSEFSMTSGTGGVLICAFGYKDVVELSVTTNDTILNAAQTQHIVDLMEKEFDILKKFAL